MDVVSWTELSFGHALLGGVKIIDFKTDVVQSLVTHREFLADQVLRLESNQRDFNAAIGQEHRLGQRTVARARDRHFHNVNKEARRFIGVLHCNRNMLELGHHCVSICSRDPRSRHTASCPDRKRLNSAGVLGALGS